MRINCLWSVDLVGSGLRLVLGLHLVSLVGLRPMILSNRPMFWGNGNLTPRLGDLFMYKCLPLAPLHHHPSQ